MIKVIAALVALVIIQGLPTATFAQEPARYNFASAQGDKELQVMPDGETQGIIYFYNIDGNRITHITLEVSEAPSGWLVDIIPPTGETQVEVNGEIVTVNENLYVEPSPVLSEAVEDPPEGTVCIKVPERGYTLAKEAKIKIKIPTTEEIGNTGDVTISATAQWLGQSGAAAIKQNRDFHFTVEVVSEAEEYQEKILENHGGKWVPWIVGIVAFVLVAAGTLFYTRRKRV